jgi:hypothetical protein
MRCPYVIGIFLASVVCIGVVRLSAQENGPGGQIVYFIPDGDTVYDTVNHVTWLADANLPAKTLPDFENFRFGIPLCDPADLTDPPVPPVSCVNPSGSMTYPSAVAWVAAMNDANYLGHHTWQLPTAPHTDTSPSCLGKGPPPYRESFAFGCTENALGFLYYEALGIKAPNTAIPIPPNTVGPFRNLQPNLYWSGSHGGNKNSLACTISNFSFASGAQGGGCGGDFADVLPMIPGKIFATSAASGMGLQVNKGGTLVYDPETIVTWLADANLAANWLPETKEGEFDTLGLPLCKTAPDTKPCVALDGSMNYESAMAFVKAMNHYEDPITHFVGYLGHTDWQLPPVSTSCKTYPYGCGGDTNPMGNLYYDQLDYDGQLGFPAGTPVVPVPDIAVGPFNHLQPFPYWECLADTIQDACEIGDEFPYTPAKNSEWGFSFGTGFLGTERFTANHYVTAYVVGCYLPDQKECTSRH